MKVKMLIFRSTFIDLKTRSFIFVNALFGAFSYKENGFLSFYSLFGINYIIIIKEVTNMLARDWNFDVFQANKRNGSFVTKAKRFAKDFVVRQKICFL